MVEQKTSAGRRPSALRRWGPLAVKFAVSAALIWYVTRDIDLDTTWDRFLGIRPEMLALAFGVFFVQLVLADMRWLAALAAIGAFIPFLDSLRIYYIGVFFNQALPSSVGGDAVRIYKAYRVGLPLGAAFNGVILERVGTVLALIILVAATQPVFLTRVSPGAAEWIVPGLAAFAVVAVVGLGVLMILDRLPRAIAHWRAVRALAVVAADTRKAFLSPRAATGILGWSLLAHMNITLGVFFLAVGLGIDVTWLDCMALIPVVILITTIPISIAGWGVRELAMVQAFGLIGVAAAEATLLSLLFGFVALFASLPGGAIWLLSSDRRTAMSVQAPSGGTPSGGE